MTGRGKRTRRHAPLILLAVLFLAGLYLRLDPYLLAPDLPYGLGDAAYHYQIGERIYKGKSLDYIWSGVGYNLRHDRFYYPPLSYYLPAYIGRVAGDFQHTVYIFNALFSSLAIVAAYLFARELFGDYPALGSAAFIAFSHRDISSLVWGQWHTAVSLTFIPLTLYFGLKSLKDPRNLSLCLLSSGLCVLTYPQTAAYPLLCILTFAVIKFRRRLPWKARDILIACGLFLIVVSPMFTSFPKLLANPSNEGGYVGDLPKMLLSWYPKDFEKPVYPPEWYSLLSMYGPLGVLTLFAGTTSLALSRQNGQDQLTLFAVMVASFYILVHATEFVSMMRSFKYLTLEAYAFSLAPAALLSSKKFHAAGAALLILFSAQQFYLLEGIGGRLFPVGVRVTEDQLAALKWLGKNTEEKSMVVYNGFNPAMFEWGSALSDRLILKPVNGRYFTREEEVGLGGDVYAIIDRRLPAFDDVESQRRLRMLDALGKQLSNTSENVFENGEITILKIH